MNTPIKKTGILASGNTKTSDKATQADQGDEAAVIINDLRCKLATADTRNSELVTALAVEQKEKERLGLIIEDLRIIGIEYAKATEYYDEIIERRFVEMPTMTKKICNQVGKEILQALDGKGEQNDS